MSASTHLWFIKPQWLALPGNHFLVLPHPPLPWRVYSTGYPSKTLFPQSHFMPLCQIDTVIILFCATHPQSWQILQEKYHPHQISVRATLPTTAIQEIFGCMQRSFPIACATVALLNRWGTYLLMGYTSPQVLPRHWCRRSLPSLWQCYSTRTSWHTWWWHPGARVVFSSLPRLHPQTPRNAAIVNTWLLHLRRAFLRPSHPIFSFTTIPSHQHLSLQTIMVTGLLISLWELCSRPHYTAYC